MEEIKVGEYIRTKNGICQLKKFEKHYTKRRTGEIENYILFDKIWYIDKYSFPPCYPTDEELEIIKKDILNHSFNIIDLIEEGDIIKFEYDNAVYIEEVIRFDCGDTYFLEVCFSPEDGVGYNANISDEDIIIKSIVTKEQFKSVEYEV